MLWGSEEDFISHQCVFTFRLFPLLSFFCFFGFYGGILRPTLEFFLLVWGRHHEQSAFLSVPHLLWHGSSVYNLPSVWQWSCHYLYLRLRSVAARIQTPNFSHARWTLEPTATPRQFTLSKGHGISFEDTSSWFFFIEGWFVPRLIEIGLVILLKKILNFNFPLHNDASNIPLASISLQYQMHCCTQK